MNPHTALLLVAGQGTRLMPLTENQPKCLVKLHNKELLKYQLNSLKAAGCNKITLVTGFKAEKIEELKSSENLDTIFNSEFASTNMIYSLFLGLESIDSNCLICYGDIIYKKELIQKMIECDADVVVPINTCWQELWQYRFENPLIDSETLRLNSDGTLKEIGQKPNNLNEIEAQYMGLIKLNKKGVTIFKDYYNEVKKQFEAQPIKKIDPRNMYLTDFIQYLIDKGLRITTLPYAGGWLEVDSITDLDLYQKLSAAELKAKFNIEL